MVNGLVTVILDVDGLLHHHDVVRLVLLLAASLSPLLCILQDLGDRGQAAGHVAVSLPIGLHSLTHLCTHLCH